MKDEPSRRAAAASSPRASSPRGEPLGSSSPEPHRCTGGAGSRRLWRGAGVPTQTGWAGCRGSVGAVPAAAAPAARCCCGSSWLRRVRSAKYPLLFSQLEEAMCIALAGKASAAKALCVCVKGRWSTPPALGQGTHGAGSPERWGTLALAVGCCSTGYSCRAAASNVTPRVGRLWL